MGYRDYRRKNGLNGGQIVYGIVLIAGTYVSAVEAAAKGLLMGFAYLVVVIVTLQLLSIWIRRGAKSSDS